MGNHKQDKWCPATTVGKYSQASADRHPAADDSGHLLRGRQQPQSGREWDHLLLGNVPSALWRSGKISTYLSRMIEIVHPTGMQLLKWFILIRWPVNDTFSSLLALVCTSRGKDTGGLANTFGLLDRSRRDPSFGVRWPSGNRVFLYARWC